MLKHYLAEALEPTLLFGILCCILGIIVASFYVKVNLSTAILLLIGVFFAHISVNVIDDYVDYKRGIDAETIKTNFSGGSSLIVNGSLKPRNVLLLGLGAFVIAAIIGTYLIVQHPIAIPFVVVGGVTILLYASHMVNVPYLAEPITAINFTLIGLGSFVVATSSTLHLLPAFLVTFPAGCMVGIALLANEMPDREIDKKHGRRSGVVMLDSNKKSAYYYLAFETISYASIAYGVIARIIPYTESIVFLLTPIVAICFLAIKNYSNPKSFEKYMGFNAIHSLLLPLFLIIGYLLVLL
jgi:1,4-dihydroxy-2-naphthoate octaprenyltransferase